MDLNRLIIHINKLSKTHNMQLLPVFILQVTAYMRVRPRKVRETRERELVMSLIKQQSTAVCSVSSDTEKVGGSVTRKSARTNKWELCKKKLNLR